MAEGPHDTPEGRVGRVTGAVRAGHTGEVLVAVRGGTERFYAYALDPDDRFNVGDTVLVTDYHPPRTVSVTAWTI